MIKTIQRNSDGKYLKSLDPVEWSDEPSEAYEMNLFECELVISDLGLSREDIKERIDLSKTKTFKIKNKIR